MTRAGTAVPTQTGSFRQEADACRHVVSVRSAPSGRWPMDQLRSTALSVVPRKQFIEAGNLVVGDAAEDVGQPNLRVDEVIATAPVYGERGAA